MNFINKIIKPTPSKELVFALEKVGGGIHKRIDENLEILELLQDKAPDLLSKSSWLVGWIKANDDFFRALAAAPEVSKVQPRFSPQPGFPREWPNKTKKT